METSFEPYVPPDFDRVHLIFSFNTDDVGDISHEAQTKYLTVRDPYVEHERGQTPFDGDGRVLFGVNVVEKAVLVCGTSPKADFRLASSQNNKAHRVSANHFRLEYNTYGAWMLVDISTHATKVDGDLIASSKAIARAASVKHPISNSWPRRALHPQKWSQIEAGRLKFYVKPGQLKPPRCFDNTEMSDFEGFDLESNGVSSTVFSDMTEPLSIANKPKIFKYLYLKDIIPPRSQRMLLMDKSSGSLVVGDLYLERSEIRKARDRYEMLRPILEAGKECNLVSFLDSVMDDNMAVIVTDHWQQSHTLCECMVNGQAPSPLELSFVAAQISEGLAHLHDNAIMVRNLSPASISIAKGEPIQARLTDFGAATWLELPTEIIGDEEYRAPEMDGKHAYTISVDVFSLCKIIRNALSAQHARNTPIDLLLERGLTVEPKYRVTASQMRQALGQTSKGDHSWPFRSLKLLRRFDLTWYWLEDKLYVLQSDFYDLLQVLIHHTLRPCEPQDIQVRSISIQDGAAPGLYCSVKFCQRVLEAYDLEFYNYLLSNADTSQYVTQREVLFNLHYHVAYRMLNVTELLKSVPLKLRLEATWAIKPQILEVCACKEWEGYYIDRDSFEQVLNRITQACGHGYIKLEQPTEWKKGSTGKLCSTHTVVIPTGWVTPRLLTVGHRPVSNLASSTPVESARLWCKEHNLDNIVEQIDRIDDAHSTSGDWRTPQDLDQPFVDNSDATTILSSPASFTAFHPSKRRKRNVASTKITAEGDSRSFDNLIQRSHKGPETLDFTFRHPSDCHTVAPGDPVQSLATVRARETTLLDAVCQNGSNEDENTGLIQSRLWDNGTPSPKQYIENISDGTHTLSVFTSERLVAVTALFQALRYTDRDIQSWKAKNPGVPFTTRYLPHPTTLADLGFTRTLCALHGLEVLDRCLERLQTSEEKEQFRSRIVSIPHPRRRVHGVLAKC